MPSTQQNSDYDWPDDYPLDDDSMIFLMREAGWEFAQTDGVAAMHNPAQGQLMRVPADEHGRTVLNAFKIYLWLTKHPLPK